MANPLDRPLSTQFFVNGVPLYEPDADGGVQMEWNSIASEGSGRTQDGRSKESQKPNFHIKLLLKSS